MSDRSDDKIECFAGPFGKHQWDWVEYIVMAHGGRRVEWACKFCHKRGVR